MDCFCMIDIIAPRETVPLKATKATSTRATRKTTPTSAASTTTGDDGQQD